MSSDYNVTFSLDGSLIVHADSEEAAEREALDLIEGFDFMDAIDHVADGCTVQVRLRYVEDENGNDERVERLERPAKSVEFA